jgi:cytochrome b6-f complex iron-sulfur subunit
MNDIERPGITPQQYEILHGGGAEAAEVAQQRLTRRRFLRRSMLAVWGVSTVASVAGALDFLYPTLSGQFGAALAVGKKSEFSPAKPDDFALDLKGVFHKPTARAYVIHLSSDTKFDLEGNLLTEEMGIQNVVKDKDDNTYWIALYQKCVHLGCTVPFRDDCKSFKCPCHGSHYNVDGGYLDGPAPRSLDRFEISFQGDDVVVNTGVINSRIQHPDKSTRLIAQPTVACGA